MRICSRHGRLIALGAACALCLGPVADHGKVWHGVVQARPVAAAAPAVGWPVIPSLGMPWQDASDPPGANQEPPPRTPYIVAFSGTNYSGNTAHFRLPATALGDEPESLPETATQLPRCNFE